MAQSKTIEKLKKYYRRLEAGKTEKIKPAHVQKVIDKLTAKEVSLFEDIAETKKASKKERLEKKLAATRKQLDRAKWLMQNLS